jgi:RNA polymerase sigma-70 factor (ECF subfamily)
MQRPYSVLWDGLFGSAQSMPRELADDEAVARVRAGDQEAFAALLRRYQDKVYSVVSNYVGAGEDALDLTQEAFVKAYSQLPRFKGRSSFYTWLYRIAVNVSIDHMRKRATRRSLSLEQVVDSGVQIEGDAGSDPQEAAERQALGEALREALDALPERLRSVVVFHDVEGMTHEEIGQILGCSVGTAKSRLSRARAELRRRLRGKI